MHKLLRSFDSGVEEFDYEDLPVLNDMAVAM